MEKKIQKKHKTDQAKPGHKEAIKGHRTRKHYLNEVNEREAEKDIVDTRDHGED